MDILYALLAVLAMFAGVVGAIALVVSVVCSIKPRYVYAPRRIHVSNEKHKDEVVEALKARRRTSLVAGLVFIGCAIYLAVYFFGGIHAASNENAHQRSLAVAQEQAETDLINPPTDEETLLALRGEEFTTDIVLPDGSTVEATIIQSRSSGLFERLTGDYKPVGKASKKALAPILDENGQFELDAAQQRQWLVYGEVYGDLEDTYGVFLDDAQRAALAVPLEEPEHLTRYGNTPLTTSLGDGTYFNGTVTLIWDDGYKLIGSEGTDQAAELARK